MKRGFLALKPLIGKGVPMTFNHGVAGSSPAGLAIVVSGTLILDGAVTPFGAIISPCSNVLCPLLQATMRGLA
jgi:hypothetical protein